MRYKYSWNSYSIEDKPQTNICINGKMPDMKQNEETRRDWKATSDGVLREDISEEVAPTP